MFKNRVLPIAIGLSIQAISYAAPNLLDVYHQAQHADPVLRQAFNQYLSIKENVPQAMARLLPSINATGYYNRHNTDIVNAASPLFGGNEVYSQWNYSLNLTQPIFNYALWMAEKQASFGARQAQATYSAAEQDLMVRTATAYFNVLRAKDSLRFAKAKKRANYRQLDQAQQRFKVGLDAITTVYEAQAAYDASKSQVIAAENNLKNQYESLRKLTNATYKAVAGLNRDHVPLVKPKPANVSSWVSTALNQNYQLAAAKFGKEAARANIKMNNADHLPTLSLDANYSETKANGTFPQFASDMTNGTVGVALNFPVFQGGLVESKTRQATYDYRVSCDKFEQTYRDVIVNTRIAYNTIMDGISKIRADRQAVKSAGNSAESTEAQFKVGTRTMVDVVTAQQQLFQAQTTLANSQYDYILALLQIKQSAGTLSVEDLAAINHWLT